MAGFAFVMMLLITVIVEACQAGLPAIASGDFSVVGFSNICMPFNAPARLACLHSSICLCCSLMLSALCASRVLG